MASPVHRLPPEILASIFQRLQDLSTPSSYFPQLNGSADFATNTYPLEQVALVCRRWREAALAVPALWSTIFHANDALIHRCISRSSAASLNVFIQCPWHGIAVEQALSRDLPLMQAIKPHLDRVQELHLIEVSIASIISSDLLQSPAPILESLTISVGNHAFATVPNTPALTTLFNGETPKLRQVAFQGFTSWSPNLFQNLTHLTLSHQDTALPIPLSQFVSYLAACPLLRDLSIIRPVLTFGGNAVTPKVPLDHLQTLSLGSWSASQHISLFLKSITLPSSVNIFIWGTRHSTDDAITDICPFPPAFISSLNITQLRITHNTDRQLGSLELGWGNEDSLYNVFLTPTKLQIDGQFLPDSVLLAATRAFPLATVTELWIGCQSYPELEKEQWKTFLSEFPLVKTLVISRRSSQPIISALTLEGGPDDASASASTATATAAQLLCPHLETLRLYADTSRSVLRLAILSEERMRLNHPILTLQVISSATRHSSRRNRSPELMSDLMYLKKYITTVERNQGESSMNWELIEEWPPKVFDWVQAERRWDD
ncbi:hypothetical protein BDN71DRAFT_1454183 [Pleurotus eryngii]|uniref:F-box domain-containing protein n=1 Tax=Pleurotus eryngii TaxID=5323 RepID=A0A9P6DCA0_PLEER|nr:hypothetical protein BDN71DRAFT_1454183 [Pleurotus eryngii]